MDPKLELDLLGAIKSVSDMTIKGDRMLLEVIDELIKQHIQLSKQVRLLMEYNHLN